MPNWSEWMEPDEVLLWQGRPAPRCFTFRHWRRAVAGAILLLLAVCRYGSGVALFAGDPALWWGVLASGLALSLGTLVRARLAWENVFYALTSRQILVQHGLLRVQMVRIPGAELQALRLVAVTNLLGHLYLKAGSRRVVLSCIEHPQRPAQLLQALIAENLAVAGTPG